MEDPAERAGPVPSVVVVGRRDRHDASVTLRATFEDELRRHGISWCTGGCRYRGSHRRGFASAGAIHLDTAIATRSTMYRGLHEVAHVVLGHVVRRGRRRWELEAEAEAWTQRRMRELRLEPPARCVMAGEAYVARMQRWGTAISRANSARRAAGLPSARRR